MAKENLITLEEAMSEDFKVLDGEMQDFIFDIVNGINNGLIESVSYVSQRENVTETRTFTID